MLSAIRKTGKSKSQVSAPIELFVAVIILALTLSIGWSVINTTSQAKCEAKLKTQTQNLKNAMLDVALGSSGTSRTVYFQFPSCGSQQTIGLQFVLYQKPEYCRLCTGTYGYCWQVVPIAKDPASPGKFVQISNAISCVNMAGDIQISRDAADAQCVELSSKPCLNENNCNAADYGISREVLDNSRWSTLSGERSSAFDIVLTKKTVLGTNGEEQGSIEVCAKKKTG
ncbi:TPA: hypothetical protein HA244_05765 [Candidatus Micrarchaeota archaeon]|nr:hypothetical protein [Candidatus Micrarchaeota archaeon]